MTAVLRGAWRGVWFGLWLGMGGMATAAMAAIAPRTITDDRGALVSLAAAPQRVVSLLPSLTETVCDLGACDWLVATDRWSNWPEAVRRLPKLGGLEDPNVEAIVAQRPDLVLVAPSSRLAARLRTLGLTVAELDASSLPQVREVMRRVAVLLDRPEQAEPRWQALQAAVDAAARRVSQSAQGAAPRVYFEVSSAPFAAGEASFIGELLTRLGARHVVPAALGPFPKLSPEFVVRANPDVLMLSAADAATVGQRPGWSGLDALRRGRVCALRPAEMDVLSRPGPRLAEGVEVLARCLSQPPRSGGARP